MSTKKKRAPWFEVFPETTHVYHDTVLQLDDEGEEIDKYYVHILSANGSIALTSDPYDTESNAIRAARAFNKSMCQSQWDIRVLRPDRTVKRTIHPAL